jgi:hypothetical protein
MTVGSLGDRLPAFGNERIDKGARTSLALQRRGRRRDARDNPLTSGAVHGLTSWAMNPAATEVAIACPNQIRHPSIDQCQIGEPIERQSREEKFR